MGKRKAGATKSSNAKKRRKQTQLTKRGLLANDDPGTLLEIDNLIGEVELLLKNKSPKRTGEETGSKVPNMFTKSKAIFRHSPTDDKATPMPSETT
ncbi:hypothetical protein NDU88_000631 [Pleurodeles waltl]|uniref:Uncharacterized protein n=1 Tax=Pleurodeles waltl TaxID=8319 RepID=A0AAV7S974_PLEWA|nr:hypothetical protein NDU88_000631 [Pleurodeles waltl]